MRLFEQFIENKNTILHLARRTSNWNFTDRSGRRNTLRRIQMFSLSSFAGSAFAWHLF